MTGLLLRTRLKLRAGRRRGALSGASPQSASLDGFALVDMLVGLAMIGVISALMMSFLSQARTIMRIEKATELQMEVEAVSRFLEAAISGAEPLPLSSSSQGQVLFLVGDASGFNSTRFRRSASIPRRCAKLPFRLATGTGRTAPWPLSRKHGVAASETPSPRATRCA